MQVLLALLQTLAVYWKKVFPPHYSQYLLYYAIFFFVLHSIAWEILFLFHLQGNENEPDETAIEEEFEEKLRDAIDGLSQKSAQGRAQCMEAICKAFTKRFMPDFVIDR